MLFGCDLLCPNVEPWLANPLDNAALLLRPYGTRVKMNGSNAKGHAAMIAIAICACVQMLTGIVLDVEVRDFTAGVSSSNWVSNATTILASVS